MTEKLFWKDPYQTEQTTKVVWVSGQDVRLQSTIFFAFSGGQESDVGTIGGHQVEEARKEGLDIVYRLPEGHGLQVGNDVAVLIDGTRRYALMRQHFAAEAVLQLVYRMLPGIVRIGAHVAPDKARLDFATDNSLSPLVPVIEEEVAALIAADLPIITGFSDEAAERRFWSVDGFAKMGCGGTHPRRTGELGAVKIKRRNPGKGKERLDIEIAG